MPLNPPNKIAAAGRHGMTLIEVLLALSIAVLIVALVFSIYHTVTVTASGQKERERGEGSGAAALDELAHDLTTVTIPEGDKSCAFTLKVGPAGFSEISFCHAGPAENEKDLLWFDLEHVTYGMLTEAGPNADLGKIHHALTGPEATGSRTNLLLAAVEQFAVRVFDGNEWQKTWPVENSIACPEAAEIEIVFRSGKASRRVGTRVLIPAGETFHSSFKRSATVPEQKP